MCTYQKYVFNKYINKRLLVSCGKCPECQQAKANLRATRIRNHNFLSDLCLFITLTYDNKFVPYVDTHQLVNVGDCEFSDVSIPIYRDADLRYYRDKSFISFNKRVIGTISKSDIKPYCYDIPQINKKPHCTSVIVWSDVQNFIKRLRINLKRDLGYDKKITYFAVGEYGGKTYRCHFHLLIYFSQGTWETLRPVIVKSWPYGDMLRKDKRIQLAIDPSSYLASYLNKHAGFPVVLESSAIRQKHSHSFHFGVGSDCFSLPSLLEEADNGDMSYHREVLDNGKPRLVGLPVPQYVINRWFPRFKGYSSFTTDEISQLLRFPIYLWNKLGYSSQKLISLELQYSVDDFRRFVVRLRHALDTYIEITHKTEFDFAIDYQRVWLARWSYCFKHSFDDIISLDDFRHFYDNAYMLIDFNYEDFVDDYDDKSSRLVLGLSNIAPTLPPPRLDKITLTRHGFVSPDYEFNPNRRLSIIRKDKQLLKQWNFKRQTREINAEVLSSIDDEF